MEAQLSLYLVVWCVIGILCAYFYGRKTKRFRWSEYAALIAAPVIGSLGLSFFYGSKVIELYLISCVVGFILEYSLGLVYHKTLNQRLWTYGKYSVGGYTSALTIPMWGVAGIVFWMLAMQIGL